MNSWKVLTLFIGANNLCDLCNDYIANGAPCYARYLEQTLDWIGDNIPRVFVNVILTLDVAQLYPLSKIGYCGLVEAIECVCGVSSDDNIRENITKTLGLYYNYTTSIINQAKYTNNDSWTVVIQPFFSSITLPTLPDGEYDLSYFAPDCFHFSGKSHQVASIALFNSIHEDVGSKTTSLNVDSISLQCPVQGELLKTAKNSANKKK